MVYCFQGKKAKKQKPLLIRGTAFVVNLQTHIFSYIGVDALLILDKIFVLSRAVIKTWQTV